MKNMFKHTAFLISLLAGLHLLVGELVRAGLLDAGNTPTGWIETFSGFVLTPTPTTILLVLALSLCVWGILSVLDRTKRKAPPPPPPHPGSLPFPPRGSLRQEQPCRLRQAPESPTISHQDCVDIAGEWNSLEEADKEAIRAIVSQKGLWETDISALLQARGFLHPKATLESLAEKVSFVHCDYAGYHSIPQEYQAQLEGVLADDHGEDSL